MYFLLTFILLYVISIVIGKFVKLPSIVSDIVVVILIFTISFWGGIEVSGSTILYVLLTSLATSLTIVVVTYFMGIFFTISGKSEWRKIDWKGQIKYLTPLILGLILGIFVKINVNFDEIIDYELYALVIVIGLQIGESLKINILKRISGLAVISIVIDVLGAVVSAILLSPFYPFKEILLTALGSGWYSYTGPFLAKYYGPTVGVFAFLVNFLREQLTFLLVPLFFRVKASPIGAIAVGGATSMDVTLPLYVDLLGNEYAIGALVNGLILTLLVPVILPLMVIL
ncbi:lysine exporter LysO family protein [Sulfurisphaera javensis]|uniref:Lysine exporter LysO family protein n=1 Tax=Sulfurisphaera javensis TaxID=2049879 RepID=A0AAT9GPW6_9CREN